jgi:hypothetical protein
MTRALLLLLGLAAPTLAMAADDQPIGQLKTASGSVTIEHGGAGKPGAPGDRVFASDVVRTGADGTVGITFADSSMMSLGPSSELRLDSFAFDQTTHEGSFDSSLLTGTLAVHSGQIVEQTPEAMKIHTPAAVLAVRGTQLVVRAAGGGS